jgi:transcriptional regulator with XRE-family HTH domain
MESVAADIKERLRLVLRRMRLAKPEFRKYSAFAKAARIHRPTVENTENGHTTPGIDIIEKWVRACGSTLTQLFMEIEGRDPNYKGMRVIAGEESYYELLTKILETGNPTYITGIKANLTAHEFTSRHSLDGTPIPTPDPQPPAKAVRGNLAPRVKKKKRVGQRSDW